jgi:succinyl-CoA synthetase beta subunit
MLEEEEKVYLIINLGYLTSGLKGGVKIVKTPQEIRDFTKQMIGYNLITHQTTKEGLKVSAVLIHEGVDIRRQIYLAFILDRNSQRPAIVCSQKGGITYIIFRCLNRISRKIRPQCY